MKMGGLFAGLSGAVAVAFLIAKSGTGQAAGANGGMSLASGQGIKTAPTGSGKGDGMVSCVRIGAPRRTSIVA